MNLKSLDTFHETRLGHLAFGLVELAMCYGFATWALDTGALWWWAAAIMLLIGGLQNLAQAIWRPRR